VLLGAVLVFSGCVFSQTGDPRVVSDVSALFTGTLQSTHFNHTEYWFEYGATTDYGTETPRQGLDVVPGAHPVSVRVNGLTPAATYHYRLCNVVPGTTPPGFACGADRTVSTVPGRVSVEGTGTRHGTFFPLTSYFTQSIDAAADPGGVGYVDGTVNDDTVAVFENTIAGETTGRGVVSCLRVQGNVAVAGSTGTYVTSTAAGVTTVQASRLFVVEDNGPTGDRYVVRSWTPSDGCPEPTSALLDGTSAPDTADFVVRGG